MRLSRRSTLHLLGASAGASLLVRSVWADFPPQSAIDNDPLRPRYHLMPRRGWINDPCAPVFYKGQYHLFLQHNPGASVWGDMHWAHAVSPDMVHWQYRGDAIAPTPGGPDSAGVFTGSMVLEDGKPVAIYTGVRKVSHAAATIQDAANDLQESQCLARPLDGTLDHWQKSPEPVIPRPPAGMKVTGFRDPAPWREKDAWYMLVASGQRGVGGNVLLYRSRDLQQWEYVKIFAEGRPVASTGKDPVDTAEMWECPDFFPLGDRHVLIHSTGGASGRVPVWKSGTLDRTTMTFSPEKEGVLNHGPYYAPKTQLDADGNRILWGWIPETRPEAEFARAGWAGCISLPRVLTLENGELCFAPAKQLDSLRGQVDLSAASALHAGSQQEVLLRVENVNGRASGDPRKKPLPFSTPLLVVETDPNGTGGSRPHGDAGAIELDVALPNHFEIRCFADRSVLEVFVANRLALTRRIYPDTPLPACRLRLPATHQVVSSRAYPLRPI